MAPKKVSYDELLSRQESQLESLERHLTSFRELASPKSSAAVIQNRIDRINELWKTCESLHYTLICCDDETFQELEYFKESTFGKFELAYLEVTDLAAQLLAAAQPATSSMGKAPSSPAPASAKVDYLPKISLPVFDGKYTDWAKFSAYFESLIIKNASIDPLQKLHYLLSSLIGEPSDLLKNIIFSPESFATAWQLLKARYNNPRAIISAQIDSLLSLPSVKANSVESLRVLHNRVGEIIAAMEIAERFANVSAPATDAAPGVHGVSDMLVCIITTKLDSATRKAWELQLGDAHEFPHFSVLNKFLEKRIRGLEAFSKSQSSVATSSKRIDSSHKGSAKSNQISSHVVATSTQSCPICKQHHNVYHCTQFKSSSPSTRFKLVKERHMCFNCLGTRHSAAQCKSARGCAQCQKRHHTLLHAASHISSSESSSQSMGQVPELSSTPPPPLEPVVQAMLASTNAQGIGHVLLATAHILVKSPAPRAIKVRALIDQGSTRSFITESLVHALNLRKVKVANSLVGIGNVSAGSADSSVHLCFGSKTGEGPMFMTNALVLRTLTSYVPRVPTRISLWLHFQSLNLADDHPMEDEPIQVILGADLYGSLLLDGLIRGQPFEPIAQNTALGWVISGPTALREVLVDETTAVFHCVDSNALNETLSKFWELENIPSTKLLSLEEQQCEAHFQATHSRTDSGRYVIRLPFKSDPPISIGYSRENALKVMNSLSRRLARNSTLNWQYSEFLKEYETLGHMIAVKPRDEENCQTVYLPHHPILKPGSATIKLRVVFNASALTSNFTSLNSHLLVGPKLCPDLFTILSQWRAFKFVYSADIAKMYRQILVHADDCDYQRILWKPSSTSEIQEYQLATLTYGTACAPYLALKVLQQLTLDEGQAHPFGTQILQRFTYVDDCLFGANDVSTLKEMRSDLCALLLKGQFVARKWDSNDSSLLVDIGPADHGLAWSQDAPGSVELKLLGLKWLPSSDSFTFEVKITPMAAVTKRLVLSLIARLYDPLGWIAHVIIRSKIFMQQLWRNQLLWDEPLPNDLAGSWADIHEDLPNLMKVIIPRWTQQGHTVTSRSLHGFADASSLAYAGVVYLQCEHSDGTVTVSLLAGKTRVAPLKTQTIPHLELCGCLLLSQLVSILCAIPEYSDTRCWCWSDSTIALSWIRGDPSRQKVFVANRTAIIQTGLPQASWHHVSTHDNPADLASRGLSASDLITSRLWWQGPSWLSQPQSHWPTDHNSGQEEEVSEIRLLHTLQGSPSTTSTNELLEHLATKYSSWPKLMRVIAYILRLVPGRRIKHVQFKSCLALLITASEVEAAEFLWFKYIQQCCLLEALNTLKTGRPLAQNHKLSLLDPFIDENGIMRVGGRLRHSKLPYLVKHPVISTDHPVIRLYVRYIHETCLHGGVQLTMSTVRQKIWLIRARHVVRAVINKCVTCARLRASTPTQLMGALPAARVCQPEKAFQHCGVDYAGPISVREVKGRGKHAHPAYISVFICMAVRAVHLELVMDATTSAFIAAFQRFISRRGIPQAMYSDCGTNFDGADTELQNMFEVATHSPEFQNVLALKGVSWKFNPPNAPHFGGLWEAGVRSVKHHTRRILKDHTPTIEEMSTLLFQIEACLNSRPLMPLTDFPDDMTALTPGHFLVGSELTALPEPTLLQLNPNRL